MIALAASFREEERKNLLAWIVPASLLLHVVGIAWMPRAHRGTSAPPPPVVLEVAEAPPPPPPPPAPAPEPTTAPEPAPRVAPVAHAPAAAPRVETASTSAAPADPGPADFTSTTFTNDGPGLAVGGGGSGPATARVAAKEIPPAPTVRVVSAASLSRRPRAPGLDQELERQYPAEARRSGISGTAVLRVRILPDGRIGNVKVETQSWNGFGPACERTVRAARWEAPIDRDGQPVATDITYTCRFEVRS